MINIKAISHHARIHLLLIFTSLLLVVMPVLNKIPSQQIAERSLNAAAQFLFLVDTEDYAMSWEVTSENLKKMLTQEAWNDQITEIRSFLGPIVERVQSSIAYTNSASDVPTGEYVIMTFMSKFELRERVTETITLMLGDNGQWRVVGYFMT